MGNSVLGQQAERCLNNLKQSVTDVLTELPVEIRQPRDVYNVLGIDRMIGWNIFKLHDTEDPFVSVKHIPRKAAFFGFLSAAARKGVAENVIGKARACFMEFEKLVKTHAGDRPSMEMMLLAYSEEGTAQACLEHRKLAFAGNRFIYGLETHTRLTIHLFEPSDSPATWKIVVLKGSFGLRRNRPNVPWFYTRPKLVTDMREQSSVFHTEPLVPPADGTKLPYYTPFCGCSLPGAASSIGFAKSVKDIFPLETGNAGLMDIVFAEVAHVGGFDITEPYSVSSTIITPCRLAVMELIMPSSFVAQTRFTARISSPLTYGRETYCDESMDLAGALLKTKHDLHIDSTTKMKSPDSMADYSSVMGDVFNRRKLDPSDYTTVRVTVQFPVVPSSLNIEWKSDFPL